MKDFARKLLAPVLNIFEKGNEEFSYKPLNRTILNVVGSLFLILTLALIFLVPAVQTGKWLPVLIFGAAGFVCLVVGTLGSNRAVAKIWGTK